MPTISLDQFIVEVEIYFKRLKFVYDEPIYQVGDRVKTRYDKEESYISKVIGAGKEGVVISKCSIPLVDFGEKIGTFYVCQKKLKKVCQ